MTGGAAPGFHGVSHHKGGRRETLRALPEERPVAVTVNGTTWAVMLMSPQDIADFALGFALTEGLISDAAEVMSLEVLDHEEGAEARLWLPDEQAEALKARRRAMAGPVGCGLCGIESLEEAARRPAPVTSALRFQAAEIAAAPDQLREMQPLYERSRATHAAGFLRPGEGVVMAREDVGRHNALDKLIGALAGAGVSPASGAFVMTSRISVELVQKCAVVGCPALIAVSAPTAYALRLARETGLTLAAFARRGGFDCYSHPERIEGEITHVA